MPNKDLGSQDITTLVDQLLHTKDPATVGLRRILKKKEEAGKDYPLQSYDFNNLSSEKSGYNKVFDDEEKRLIELEKSVIQLKQMLVKQKENAEKAIEQSYQSGLKEGIEKGEKQAKDAAQSLFNEKIQEVEKRINTLFSSFEESQKKVIVDSHKQVMEICLLIAKKILNHETTVDQESVLHVIKKALSHLADRQEFTIRVSPKDLSVVTEKRELWSSISDQLDTITIKEDERIEQGGCIIESANGVIDARMATQMHEMAESIESVWESVFSNLDINQSQE